VGEIRSKLVEEAEFSRRQGKKKQEYETAEVGTENTSAGA
jgi:hypothetical protein